MRDMAPVPPQFGLMSPIKLYVQWPWRPPPWFCHFLLCLSPVNTVLDFGDFVTASSAGHSAGVSASDSRNSEGNMAPTYQPTHTQQRGWQRAKKVCHLLGRPSKKSVSTIHFLPQILHSLPWPYIPQPADHPDRSTGGNVRIPGTNYRAALLTRGITLCKFGESNSAE